MSCHFAIPVNGLAVVIDALRCKYLVRDGSGQFLCSVYERRFELAPWCHTAQSALTGGFLAQDCPYARGVPGYRGKVRLSPALLRKVLPAVRAEVARAGAPLGADPDAVATFLGEETGAAWKYGKSADGSRYLFTPDQAEIRPPPAAVPAPEIAPAAAAKASAADATESAAGTGPGRRSARLRVL